LRITPVYPGVEISFRGNAALTKTVALIVVPGRMVGNWLSLTVCVEEDDEGLLRIGLPFWGDD
jgi:hypothetical protein